MENTVWKILEEDDNYEISSIGQIRNKTTLKLRALHSNGKYKQIRFINRNNKSDGIKYRKKDFIHRLVAKYFVSNPFNYPIVNHIDGNKNNNQATNLEWSTYSNNLKHSREVLNNYHNVESGCKLSINDIHLIRNLAHLVSGNTLAEIFEVSISHISAIKNNKIYNSI